MSKQKKQVVNKTIATAQKSVDVKQWIEIENHLNKNFRFVLGGLLIAAAILRVVYFVQLNNTPCIYWHLQDQSDMYFFDKWAKHLANEDWLQHTSFNNYTNAHKWIAEAYLNKHPEKIEELKKQLSPETEIDFKDYGRLLFNSWQGDKVYFQEPFYVYFVATIYKIFGPDVRYVFLIQLLIGMGSMALIFLITRNYFGNIASVISGLLALLHGPLLFYDLILLRESMIVFAGLLLVYSIGQTLKNKSTINLLATGFIIGISLLIKSIFVIFGLLLLVLIYLDSRKNKQPLTKNMLLPIAGMIAGLLPLIIRNLIVGISPLSVASNSAFSFISCNYYGYNPILAFALSTSNADIFYKTNGAFLSSVIESIKTFPSLFDYADLLWQKFKLIFLWTELPNNKSYYYFKINAPVLNFTFINYSTIAALGLTGIVVSFYRKKKPWSLYLLLFTHFAVLLGFLVLSRYRVPFTAALLPFCGLVVSEFFKKAETKNLQMFLIVLPVLVLFLIVNRDMPEGVIPIRAADYLNPYYFFYKPKIDTALKNNHPELALKEMETFFKITPPVLERLDGSIMNADINESNVASAYGELYDDYAKIASANKLYDLATKYRNRSSELKNISDRFGPALDAFGMVKKARTITDPNQKKTYLEKAVTELQLRLKANPNDFNALATMSDVMLDDFHDSAQFEYYIKTALKVQPDHAKAQFKLAHYYLQSGKNTEEAKRLIDNSMIGWSDNSQAYTDLGYYFALQNKMDTARKLWNKALLINPADCTAVNDLRILSSMKN